MQAREDLLDTIQRLLALSSSPNEHEAQLALAKAHELMARHNLSLAEVQTAGDSHYDSREAWQGRRLPVEFPTIAPILLQFFFVRGCVERRRSEGTVSVLLFGEPHNVAIAVYLLGYLTQVYRRLARQARVPRNRYQAYTVGLGYGLQERLRRERQTIATESGTALIRIDKALEDAFERARPDLGSAPRRRTITEGHDWFVRGTQDAGRIQLRTGLAVPKQQKLLQ